MNWIYDIVEPEKKEKKIYVGKASYNENISWKEKHVSEIVMRLTNTFSWRLFLYVLGKRKRKLCTLRKLMIHLGIFSKENKEKLTFL